MPIVHKCVVCGKVFYEGQGIIISRGDITLEFHSSKCAAAFFKRLILDSDDISCVSPAIKKLLAEYEEAYTKRINKKIG